MAEGIDGARSAALDLLNGVLHDRRPISEMTGDPGPLSGLAPSERARAQRLALSTLRHCDRADAVLKPMLRKAPPAPVRNVLRLAVVEMLQEGAAPHGVVNSAVALLRRDRKTAHLAGLANAVLRKASEIAPDTWHSLPPQRMPGWLRGRLESILGRKTVEALEAAHARGAPLDLTAKANPEELARSLDGELLPTGSVRLHGSMQVSAIPGYDTGDWWVQDAAAAIPAKLMAARPGEQVLDLCAAPGGKAMQLAATGADVTALDISGPRARRLEENLARTRLTARIVVADALEWRPDQLYDAILLDAPCTATGTIRRHPDLPFVRTGKDVKPLVLLQAQMLERALNWLKPGGRLVYCTCSLLPEEGENQISAISAARPELVVEPPTAPWIEPHWRTAEGGLRLRPDFWPDRGGMDGFYIGCLRNPA